MSIASATADVRAAMAALESAYFALQRQIAASVGSAVYPEVQAACDAVRDVYHVGPLEVVGRKRDAGVCWARHVAIWLVHGVGRMSLAQIGEAFGGRDHGTVYNAVQRVDEALETDAVRAVDVKKIKAAFDAKVERQLI